MNYDDHEDFNKARTPEESTKQFAHERAAVYDNANAVFAGGTRDAMAVLGIGLLVQMVLWAI